MTSGLNYNGGTLSPLGWGETANSEDVTATDVITVPFTTSLH